MIAAALPSISHVREEKEVVHSQFDDLVNETADGDALAEGEGVVMNTTICWLFIFAHLESVAAREAVRARSPTLVKKIQVKFKVGIEMYYRLLRASCATI